MYIYICICICICIYIYYKTSCDPVTFQGPQQALLRGPLSPRDAISNDSSRGLSGDSRSMAKNKSLVVFGWFKP